jgi:hypothetical protein
MEPDAHAARGLVEVVRLRDQVDQLAEALLPSRSRVFGEVSLPLPNLEGSSELAFIRTTSWLYVHYFEVGRVGVRFLVRQADRQPGSRHGDSHLDAVHALRTHMEHSLDPRSKSDVAIADACSSWFEANCGTRLPRTENHWRDLCAALIKEARAFVLRLRELLGQVEHDNDRELILRQWEDRIERDWPAHRYHELIATVAADVGREALDPVAFFSRHASTISEGMRLLREDCDFHIEARKLVERAMLSETSSVLPITGKDLMEALQIPPGAEVGRLLGTARSLYEASPCGRDELLQRVTEKRESQEA